mmetsp:Transcript_34050/g.50856  ORF Transcript_34050/g.50856 Transcript_34050/m.50856 type:complete len:231 (-) Transcript_34050:588-1280(-)
MNSFASETRNWHFPLIPHRRAIPLAYPTNKGFNSQPTKLHSAQSSTISSSNILCLGGVCMVVLSFFLSIDPCTVEEGQVQSTVRCTLVDSGLLMLANPSNDTPMPQPTSTMSGLVGSSNVSIHLVSSLCPLFLDDGNGTVRILSCRAENRQSQRRGLSSEKSNRCSLKRLIIPLLSRHLFFSRHDAATSNNFSASSPCTPDAANFSTICNTSLTFVDERWPVRTSSILVM